MKHLIIIAVCVAVAQTYSVRDPKASLLTPVPAGGRVIQGEPAVNGQFPHMAFVYPPGCGGSLIDAKWVLTAAHCVDDLNPRQVYLGHVEHNLSPVNVRASKVHVYPGWNPSNVNNDIALLELDNPVTFSDNIKPIRVANSRDDLFVDELATLSGFGYVNDNFESPNVLQHVNLTIISNDECREYFHIFVIDSTICANGAKNPAQGSCFGDSGSGLILRRLDGDLLIGVTSFIGWEGCEGHNPSGFVRPNYYLDWIRNTTGLSL